MNAKQICDSLKKVTYLISVFKDGELVSQGTGVCINGKGDLITAAHVISGSLPVRPKDVQDLVIIARAEGNKLRQYKHLICGLNMSSSYIKAPVTIDLSILRCVESLEDVDYIEIDQSALKAGEEILMCGYSDEVTSPFDVFSNFDYKHGDFRGIESLVRNALDVSFQFSMSKRGMIGRVYNAKFSDDKLGTSLSGSSFYIDNAMHSGASGGPIVNSNGNLIGIITQRAITDYSTGEKPGLKVPSGSTIGITPGYVLEFLHQLYQEYKIHVEWHACAAT